LNYLSGLTGLKTHISFQTHLPSGETERKLPPAIGRIGYRYSKTAIQFTENPAKKQSATDYSAHQRLILNNKQRQDHELMIIA